MFFVMCQSIRFAFAGKALLFTSAAPELCGPEFGNGTKLTTHTSVTGDTRDNYYYLQVIFKLENNTKV